jgi:hypothetical protein
LDGSGCDWAAGKVMAASLSCLSACPSHANHQSPIDRLIGEELKIKKEKKRDEYVRVPRKEQDPRHGGCNLAVSA